MSERLLSSVRVNDDDQLEAWWYEPPPREAPTDPHLLLFEIPDYPRVRYWLTSAKGKRREVSQADADVLVRMAQIAERYR